MRFRDHLGWITIAAGVLVLVEGIFTVSERASAGAIFTALFFAVALLGIELSPRRRRQRRLRRGRCPGCGYDLRHDLDPGCPECGWGRQADPLRPV